MTHKTRAVAARLFLGGLLLGSPLLAGCGGGGGSSSPADQFAKGASITKQAHVVAETAVFFGSTQPRTIYLLRDTDGQLYSPTTLDPAFQKDGLNVQFSATVIDNGVGVVDGTGGVYITITSIHAV